MNNPVIVADLDGTLLTSNNVIPQATLTWIARWMEEGGQFVVATGRHYQNIKGLFASCTPMPQLITANGAMINAGMSLSPEACRVHHLAEMATLAEQHQLHFSVFTEAGWHVTSRNAMVNAHDFDAIITTPADFVRLPAFKALFYGESMALKALLPRLQTDFPDQQAVQSDAHWLEVQRQGINKFNALQDLLTRLKLTNRPTLAFGDGLNDLELLLGCTQGVVMSNAMPELKALLPEHPVTFSNDAEGVRMYLESLLP